MAVASGWVGLCTRPLISSLVETFTEQSYVQWRPGDQSQLGCPGNPPRLSSGKAGGSNSLTSMTSPSM